MVASNIRKNGTFIKIGTKFFYSIHNSENYQVSKKSFKCFERDGWQSGAYESRREIRLSERFQVFDIRNMVDKAGYNKGDCRSGKDDKDTRPYG